jgi:uncharacterized metal-binding protein YceD (DUF177 family)
MSQPVLSFPYNLNRLGQAGDDISISATEEQRAAIAGFADVLRVNAFEARVILKKLSTDRFRLDFRLNADLVQACVVTLGEVPAQIAREFLRELHFNPALRRAQAQVEAEDILLEDDQPEEIDSLHYDLAGPLIEEFLLALEPYPRAAGVEFQPPDDGTKAPESPFAVLKGLKSGL